MEEQWKREIKRREKGGREHCKKTRSPEAIAVLLLLETRGRNVFGFYLGLWAISVFPPLIFLDEFFYNIMVRNVELKKKKKKTVVGKFLYLDKNKIRKF